MKYSLRYIMMVCLAACLFASCEKKVDPINEGFTVNVDFKNSGSKYVVSDVEVNPKDSIYFDFTITALEDMSVIEIQKNGAKLDTFRVTGTDKRSFSAVKKYMSDSIPNDYTYRILARNSQGTFIGDGNKSIKVTVKSDFYYWSYRFLYVPDTVAKTNKTYFATSTGESYSYTTGAPNSGIIDFGYFYDTTTSGAPKNTIYALTNSNVFTPYDLSSWTKNATIFKKGTSPSFANLTSGGALRTGGISNLASGASSKAIQLAAGNVIFFKTVTGKYGAIQINYLDAPSASPSSYINIDVKVQK